MVKTIIFSVNFEPRPNWCPHYLSELDIWFIVTQLNPNYLIKIVHCQIKYLKKLFTIFNH